MLETMREWSLSFNAAIRLCNIKMTFHVDREIGGERDKMDIHRCMYLQVNFLVSCIDSEKITTT